MGPAKRRTTRATKTTPTAAKRMIAAPRRGRRRQGLPNPWIVGLAGVVALVALQVTVNAVAEARLPGERFRSQGNIRVSLGANTLAHNPDPPPSRTWPAGTAGW